MLHKYELHFSRPLAIAKGILLWYTVKIIIYLSLAIIAVDLKTRSSGNDSDDGVGTEYPQEDGKMSSVEKAGDEKRPRKRGGGSQICCMYCCTAVAHFAASGDTIMGMTI